MATRIFLVEDDDVATTRFQSLLEADGFRIAEIVEGARLPRRLTIASWMRVVKAVPRGHKTGKAAPLTRAVSAEADAMDVLISGGLSIESTTQRVFRGGRELMLTPMEFRLLELLVRNPGRIFPPSAIVQYVWPPEAIVNPRTVHVHVGRLRKVLRRAREPDAIKTFRGQGYSYRPRVPKSEEDEKYTSVET